MKFLIGCYTSPDHKGGINLFELDERDCTISLIETYAVTNPSYVAFSPIQPLIYAVNENHSLSDSVTALSLDKRTNKFQRVNELQIGGSDPCFISVDSAGKHLFTANYSDGTLSCISIQADGSLANLVQLIKHSAVTSDSLHQKTHIHGAVLSPDERFLLVTNLGQDTISIYPYEPWLEEMPLNEEGCCTYNFPTGTGPRHLVFDEKGSYVYVVGELSGTLHVLKWVNHSLVFIEEHLLMDSDFDGVNSAADVHFGVGGKFLYLSNRGDANMIISFVIDKLTGRATLNERVETKGKGPRNFAIDKSGSLMIVAHQHSNDITVFLINPLNGSLYETGKQYLLHSPVFVSFL